MGKQHLINELQTELGKILQLFQSGARSADVEAQLNRWRITARRKIDATLGNEEGEIFNGLALAIGLRAGFYPDQDDMTLDYIQQAASYLEALEKSVIVDNKSQSRINSGLGHADPKKVFVVCGRSESLNRAFYSFLRALKLTPYEWEEAVALVGGSPYVGDVIMEGMKQAQATVVLLTPDELVSLRAELSHDGSDPDFIPQHQPRPNVLFEAGIAMQKDEKRTILVQIGKQRSFSDIFGRHLVRFDGSEVSRNTLASRLRAAGCAVETVGNHWLSEGNFSVLQEQILEQPKKEEANNLTESEKTIIKLIAQSTKLTKPQLMSALAESEVRVNYYLSRLDEKRFVKSIWGGGRSPTQYRLTDTGTKYAVEELRM